MRRRDRSIPPRRNYAQIVEDLNKESEAFKKTPLYKRLVIKAEMLREDEVNNYER